MLKRDFADSLRRKNSARTGRLGMKIPIVRSRTMNHLSLLLTIWVKPRDTVRSALESPSPPRELILAWLFGIGAFLERSEEGSFGDDLSLGWILALAFTVGPLIGLLSLYLISALLHWTGKLFGGRAGVSELRTAVAHGWIPFIWLSAAQAIPTVMMGQSAFARGEASDLGDFGFLQGILVGLLPIWVLLGVWMAAIAVLSVAEAQGFSAWMALANYFLAFMIMVVAAVVVAIAVVSFVALTGMMDTS